MNLNFISFKKNEKIKKNFLKKKNNNKNNKYNNINNIKDIQIKEESESDSISIDEEEKIIKNPLKNQDIKIKIISNQYIKKQKLHYFIKNNNNLY